MPSEDMLYSNQVVTVLLGSAGSASSYGVARTLRDVWGDRVRIIAADARSVEWVPAASIADGFVQVPLVESPTYKQVLLQALTQHSVDVVFPTWDSDVVAVAELAEAGLVDPSLAVVTPAATVGSLCRDKLSMARWLAANRHPTPRTVAAEHFVWTGERVFVKPRWGIGSRDTLLVTSEDQFRNCDGQHLIVQEVCRPPEITIDAFRARNSQQFGAVCRERVEVKAGICTKARVFHNSELQTLAESVGRDLGLVGPMCLQVMRDPEGDGWCITDVNPRPGAATRMSVVAGYDVISAAFADAIGEDASPFLVPLPSEATVVRAFIEVVSARQPVAVAR